MHIPDHVTLAELEASEVISLILECACRTVFSDIAAMPARHKAMTAGQLAMRLKCPHCLQRPATPMRASMAVADGRERPPPPVPRRVDYDPSLSDLCFRVEQWTRDGLHPVEMLAASCNIAIARAAFEAATVARPGEWVTLKHGIMLMGERRGDTQTLSVRQRTLS